MLKMLQGILQKFIVRRQLQDKKTENEENDEKLMVLLHQISL